MEARPIGDFFNNPNPPPQAVLLGKGPSLDLYTPGSAPAGAYVMGMNEVPLVTHCDGVIFADRFFVDVDYLATNPDIDIFRSHSYPDSHGGSGYMFVWNERPKGYPPEYWLPCPGPACACRALTILALWGVTRVHLWGLDMVQNPVVEAEDCDYAERVKDSLVVPPHPCDYTRIAEGFVTTLGYHDLEAVWPDGKLCEYGSTDRAIRV